MIYLHHTHAAPLPCKPRSGRMALAVLALAALALAGCSGKEPLEETALLLEVDGKARINKQISGDKAGSAVMAQHLDIELMVTAACEIARMVREDVKSERTGGPEVAASPGAGAKVGDARPGVAETESITTSTARVEFKPFPLDPEAAAIINQSVYLAVCKTEKNYRGSCERDQRPPSYLKAPPGDHLALLKFMQETHGMKANARWETTQAGVFLADRKFYRMRQTMQMDLNGYSCSSAMRSESRG